MAIADTLYGLTWALARPLLPLAAQGTGKFARSVRGRAGLMDRLAAFAAGGRDPSRPLVWFHAPSVGEGLQARAVVEALRARRPDVQVAYTFFSASAERFARSVPAEFIDYLPWDAPAEVARALDLLGPSVLAYSKADVWPALTRAAAERGVRTALLSATLPATSSRLRGPARALLGRTYALLDAVAAISAADAERFGALGVAPDRRGVMGDARFDQVRRRADAAERGAPLLAPLAGHPGPTLVAGSTWPVDERHLVPAVAAVRAAGIPLRLVLVPHEPTAAHLEVAEAALREADAAPVRLSEVAAGAPPGDTVLVDRVGVLGDLYALADLAYVGGGFGRAGLHSVLEPAAFGAPVLFGPRHANAREAAELVQAEAGWEVEDARQLESVLTTLLRDPGLRARSGLAARTYVDAGLGAAARGADLIASLLPAAVPLPPRPPS